MRNLGHLLLYGVLATVVALRAQPPATRDIPKDIQKFALPNGLEVVHVRDAATSSAGVYLVTTAGR